MPMPVSSTLISIIVGGSIGASSALMVIVPCSGVYLMALSRRFENTCPNRSSSPRMGGNAAGIFTTTRCCFCSMRRFRSPMVRSMRPARETGSCLIGTRPLCQGGGPPLEGPVGAGADRDLGRGGGALGERLRDELVQARLADHFEIRPAEDLCVSPPDHPLHRLID